MSRPDLYDVRFSAAERAAKDAVWRVLCEDFFQRHVPADAVLIDLGAGLCEFVNHIRCRERWAVEVDEAVRTHAAPGVQVHCGPAHDLGWRASASVDVIFASNIFEHFERKEDVLTALREGYRVLRPGGRFLILQPNIRYAYKVYWDFFDHHLPLSDRSMVEALAAVGYRLETVSPRFLPYTTKSALPTHPWLVRLYLRLPPLHRLFGKQMFIVAVRP